MRILPGKSKSLPNFHLFIVLTLLAFALPSGVRAQLPADRFGNPTQSVTQPLALNCNTWLGTPSRASFVKVGDLDVPGHLITVEAMFSRTAPYSGGNEYAGDVVSKHHDPDNINYLLRPNSAAITTADGVYHVTPPVCDIELNKTYHIAMTYDGTTLKFYRNGFLMSQVAVFGDMWQSDIATQIGNYEGNLFNEQLVGFINEVRIWNVARTQAEIQANMNSPLPAPTTQAGLLAYYNFNNLQNKQGNPMWNGTLGGSAAINRLNPTCAAFVADNRCCPTFSGTISGSTVCKGEPGMLTFKNTTVPAAAYYRIVYSDGVSDYTKTNVQDGVAFATQVVPGATTTYTLKSIGDGALCTTDISGQSATVTVKNCDFCNSWLSVPSYPSFAKVGDLDVPGNQITVEAMFNRTVPYSGGNEYAGDLVSKHKDPVNANYLLRPNSASLTTTDGVYHITPAVCDIELNKTYHVAMVYDGATLKFYRNGFLMSQVAVSGNMVQNDFATQIGLYEANLYNEQLVGYINEVRIWNVARSQAQIQTYMNSVLPSPTTQTGLQAYYSFNSLLNKQGNPAWNATLGGPAAILTLNPTCATFTADNRCCPVFSGTISGNAFCSGKPAQLTFHDATVPPGGPYTITYTDGTNTYVQNGVTDNVPFNIQGTPAQTTIYKLISIQNGAGCKALLTDTALVTLIKLSGTLTGDTVCDKSKGMLTFHSTSNISFPTYEISYFDGTNIWTIPDVQDGVPFYPSVAPNGLTTYTLKGISSGDGGCYDVVPAQTAYILVVPTKYPDFVYTRDVCDPFGFHFKATGESFFNDQVFSWNIDGTDYKAATSVDTLNIQFPNFGTHQVSISMDYNKKQCATNTAKNITITLNAGDIILTPDTSICFGDSIQLRAVKALHYCWIQADLDHPDSANPKAKPLVPTSYALYAETMGTNLALNGDFSSGNTSFTSGENFAGTGAAVNTYTIASNPKTWNAVYRPIPDHTGANGNMLVVNAGPAPSRPVWTEGIDVVAGTAYTVSFWAAALSGNEVSSFEISLDGSITTLSPMKLAGVPLGKWQQFSLTWVAGTTKHADISILTTGSVTATGHGFAVDDIFFGTTDLQSDGIQVGVDKPAVVASDDITVCKGSRTPLGVSGAVSYVWSPATTLSAATGSTVTDTAYRAQQFIVTGTDALGCKAEDSVTVRLFPKIAIAHSPDLTVCPGTPATLHASGGTNFIWTPAALLDNPASADPVATVMSRTKFYIGMTDDNGCSESDSLTLSIRPKPLFHAPDDQVVCKGSSVILKNANDGSDVYSWSPGDGLDNPAAATPRSMPEASIIYALHIADPVCSSYDSNFIVNVEVKSPPTVTADRSNDIDCAHLGSQLTAVGAVSYTWTPAQGLNNPLLSNPVAVLDSTTAFIVEGLSENGCAGYDTVTVIVKNEGKLPLSMPNAFTPNGDGLNDCYGIRRWGDITLSEFSIYNRWGQRVFTTANTSECWDGTFHGQRQDTGQFIYVLRGSTFCGVFTKTGPFVLIR